MTTPGEVTVRATPRYTLGEFPTARTRVQRKPATQPYWPDNRQGKSEWEHLKPDPSHPCCVSISTQRNLPC
jgi:hypothetical protein